MATALLPETCIAHAAEEIYLLEEDSFEGSYFEIEDYVEEDKGETSVDDCAEYAIDVIDEYDQEDDQYEIIEDIEAEETVVSEYAADEDSILDDAVLEEEMTTSIEIIGQDYVVVGAKASFKVVVSPLNAKNKMITWELDKEYSFVSINKSNGQVKVARDAQIGTQVTVIARAIDQGGASARKTFTIKEKARKVMINTPATQTIATHAIGDLKTSVTLDAYTDNEEIVSWKISDPKKASINVNGNKATVTAHAPGEVKVTAYANDGSGKKAEVKLKVIIPASSLKLTVPIDRLDNMLASGGSLKFTPAIGEAYGKPSSKKIEWSYEIIGYKDDDKTIEKEISPEILAKIKKKRLLFSINNGKLTAVKQSKFEEQSLALWDENGEAKYGIHDYGVKITARTIDGSNLSVSKVVKRVDCSTYMSITGGNKFEIPAGYETLIGTRIRTDYTLNGVYIINPHKEIATVSVDAKSKLKIYAKKPGKTNVTLKTMDGSNKKVTVKINVYEKKS